MPSPTAFFHHVLENKYLYIPLKALLFWMVLHLPHLTLKTSFQYKELYYNHTQILTTNIVLPFINRFLHFFSICRISEIPVQADLELSISSFFSRAPNAALIVHKTEWTLRCIFKSCRFNINIYFLPIFSREKSSTFFFKQKYGNRKLDRV